MQNSNGHDQVKTSDLIMKSQLLKLLNNFSETRKRKRRWGDENDKVPLGAPILLPTPGVLPSGPLKNVGKNNPELIQYAIRVFGSTDLTDSQWKQCEDQIKVYLRSLITKMKLLDIKS